MKFIEDNVGQISKHQKIVCGDYYLCERTLETTTFVLCDGIGSGVYANIAAITCGNRMMELIRLGVSFRSACEMVAESMHRARKEQIPFSAFSATQILSDGQFTVYFYESPKPMIIKNNIAQPINSRIYTVSYEVIGEATGTLDFGDTLVLYSDGVTQAGMGNRYSMGIGVDGLAEYLNHLLLQGAGLPELVKKVIDMTCDISGGFNADDTTIAMMHCRAAKELTILTGPPSLKSKDHEFAERLLTAAGIKVVCGSSTADMVARELGREIKLLKAGTSFGSPPEYSMNGVDLITEGAVLINQVYNILGENPNELMNNSTVEKLCLLMHEADVVRFIVGNAINDAHASMLFKQIGVRPRRTMVKFISEQLKSMGKLVVEEYY